MLIVNEHYLYIFGIYVKYRPLINMYYPQNYLFKKKTCINPQVFFIFTKWI